MDSYAYQLLGSLIKKDRRKTLPWRHNGRDSVSNHQPHDCLLNRLFRRRPKKTSKLRFTGLCAGKSPVTGEFPAQMASNAENVSIWWRHHETTSAEPQPIQQKVNRAHNYWDVILKVTQSITPV